ncbi:MAG: DNA polymerase III subunit alpha [Candidatus Dadabacteria bacterium]|nr:MAG: DNA polymerase III subunit alpha [Candidatus Dadabacteria bacterium]
MNRDASNSVPQHSGSYVPLWCQSGFSFLEGASHPEELVAAAAEFELPALALTDRHGVYGLIRAWRAARERGLRLIAGACVTLEAGDDVLLLAQDQRGYEHLCQLLTAVWSRRTPQPLAWSNVQALQRGLLLLWRCTLLDARQAVAASQRVQRLQQLFGDRFYLMLSRHQQPGESEHEILLRDMAEEYQVPLVAVRQVLYHDVRRKPLQDVLTCIRHRTTLDQAGDRLSANDQFALLSPAAFARLYRDLPEAVARTHEIAERCAFDPAALRYHYPPARLQGESSPDARLRRLTYAGLRERLYLRAAGRQLWRIIGQAERELALIAELSYAGYFLTMHEIVEFCREQGILCQGRGSAANSVVCYALGITNVDPVRIELLFERFLSRERQEPPDIDLDIEHRRREEVIQFVYRRYGHERAAMVASVITWRVRSAVREVGKVFALPQEQIDRLARLVDRHDPSTLALRMREAGLDPETPLAETFLKIVSQIVRMPRHLALHPGGFLLGDRPISCLVPVQPAAMPGRTLIQWDKDDLETAGLFKVDLLGLGALTHLQECFALLRRHRPEVGELSLLSIPADDPETYDMICRADTVGVFQIESRAQMAMLGRLKPRHYYDLVIEISIIRPGPITGGMVHPYLRRRQGQEAITYPHPSLEPVLRRTLGIPLFQEQVISLAMRAADYTAGEADQLRRDMAAWRKHGRIEQHRERLIGRMVARGIEKQFAEQVFEQIRGFGEYGFPESHAASFAHIAYATAWLKCHYPVEFTCGLLNAQPMGFYSIATILGDARRHGVEVRPVDVQRSFWDCTLEPVSGNETGFALRVGLRFIRGLERLEADQLIEQRMLLSRPEDLACWLREVTLKPSTWRLLAEAGALDRFGYDRRELLWLVTARRRTTQQQLELALEVVDDVPRLPELQEVERLQWDIRHKRHSEVGHVLRPWRSWLTRHGFPDARRLRVQPDGKEVAFVGAVICRQRPQTAGGVLFLTLEDETGFVNVIVWPDLFERQRQRILGQQVLGVRGRLQQDAAVIHVVAHTFFVPDLPAAVPATKSRDFQ